MPPLIAPLTGASSGGQGASDSCSDGRAGGEPLPPRTVAPVLSLAMAILVPGGILALGAWMAWGQIWDQARTELTASAGASAEYVARVLDGHTLLVDRLGELLAGLGPAEIREREQELHGALQRLAASHPAIQSLHALDAAGRPLVASDRLPVPREVSARGRDVFEELQAAGAPAVLLSRIHRNRLDGSLYLALAKRLGAAAPGGSALPAPEAPFHGVALVLLRPDDMALGLRRIAETADQSAMLIRTDGEILCHCSASADLPPPIPQGTPLRSRLDEGADRGTVEGPIRQGGPLRLAAFRKVHGWPVYAVVHLTRDAVVARWWRLFLWQAGFGIPAMLTLIWLVLLALRRTQQVAEARTALRSEEERRRSAEALNESDARYRALVEATPEGVAIHDARRIVEVNDAFWRMFGYQSRDAVLGRSPVDFIGPEARTDTAEKVGQCHGQARESLGLRPDGSTFPVEFHAQPILYQGEPMRVDVVRDLTAQRAAERALRDTLATLDLGAFMAWDLDGPIRHWSAGCERLFGWTAEEAVGRVPQELLHTIPPISPSEIRAMLERSGEWSGELRHRTRSCHEVVVATRMALRRDLEGRPVGVIEAMVDVTPIWRARSELVDRSARLQILSEAAGKLLGASDLDAVLEDLFHSLSDKLGIDISLSYVADDAVGDALRLTAAFGIPDQARQDLERIPPGATVCGAVARSRTPIQLEAVQDARDPMADFVRGLGIRAHVAFPLVTGGRLVGVLSFGTRRHDRLPEEDLALLGTLAQHVAVLRGRLGAEEALRVAEQQMRSILETIPDAMVVIDERGIVVSFSAAAERLFGWSKDDIVGRNVSMLMPPPDRDRHDGYIARYLTTGKRRIIGTGRVVHGQRRDGTTFPMRIIVGEVKGVGRHLFTGFVHDLTAQHDTERRLEELRAELLHVSRVSAAGEMASALAHELNQPLTAIASSVKAALRVLQAASAGPDGGPAAPGQAMEAMERAVGQSLRAGQIVRRLREFVAKGEANRRIESLPRLIEEASTLALVGARQGGVQVTFRISPHLAPVLVDRIQLQQVLLNLIRNAIEAMIEGEGQAPRRLVVAAAPHGAEEVEISVADTGPGLAPQVAARLFEPFVSTKLAGMGVGLSICQSIIKAHGGRLWAEPNPGGGTVFRLTLPAVPPGDAATRDAPQ